MKLIGNVIPSIIGASIEIRFVLSKRNICYILNICSTFSANDYQEKLEIAQIKYAIEYIKYISNKTVRFNTMALNHV